MTTEEPRRLRGHKSVATFCLGSRDRPGVVATSGEDGRVCWFDMRCEDVQIVMELGDQPISSLCFKAGNEDIIYVSSGNEIKNFDMRKAAPWKPLESYSYNMEEINQISCNSKAAFLASADDGGEVKVIDINQHHLYKTLRAGHTSICSSVQFIPWRPWEVITGGLDSKIVMWDFSRGRPIKTVDFALLDTANGSNASQCLNPAFVHAIAVPDTDMLDKSGRICVVARGDGVVDVINIENEFTSSSSKGSKKLHKGSKPTLKDGCSAAATCDLEQMERNRLHLDFQLGGHTAAVSSVAFSLFGERGKFIVSGGNDKLVKVWNHCKFFDDGQTCNSNNILHVNINLNKKVNWLCTTPSESENLVICDTTKVVKVYSIF